MKQKTLQKNKQIYIWTESEITKKPAEDSKYKNARSDLMGKIIKNCRGVKKCNDDISRMKKKNKEKILDPF